jgi:hypothetical protein
MPRKDNPMRNVSQLEIWSAPAFVDTDVSTETGAVHSVVTAPSVPELPVQPPALPVDPPALPVDVPERPISTDLPRLP